MVLLGHQEAKNQIIFSSELTTILSTVFKLVNNYFYYTGCKHLASMANELIVFVFVMHTFQSVYDISFKHLDCNQVIPLKYYVNDQMLNKSIEILIYDIRKI